MKKKSVLRSIFLVCFIVAILLTSLIGCEEREEKMKLTLSSYTKDFMEGSSSQFLSSSAVSQEYRQAVTDFSFALLREAATEGENALLSPLSVYLALSMVANGTKGEEQSAFSDLLGLSIASLNQENNAFWGNRDQSAFRVANSLWLKDQVAVSSDFIEANRKFYGADVYGAPFDATTVSDVNAWVEQRTYGMIDRITEGFSPDELLFLVNAVAFEDRWLKPFDRADNKQLTFFGAAGEETGEFLSSAEELYLENATVEGFLKRYQDDRYAFFALLPKENISLEALLQDMSADDFLTLMEEAENHTFRVELPRIKAESDLDLKKTLSSMGLSSAFIEGITDIVPGESLALSSVRHKTFFELSESGTKAAAATGIGIKMTSLAPDDDLETLRFCRPFLYGIVDTETSIPIFIGCCYQLG